MAQRARHEMNVKTERAARMLFEHKALLLCALIVIAVACGTGLSMFSGAGRSNGVEISRGDSAGASDADSLDSDSASRESPDPLAAGTSDTASSEAYVDIDGAVQNPGVYRLTTANRISDAIDAAGGLSEDADVASVNRASKVIDGQKIHIPHIGEAPAPVSSDTSSSADVSGGISNTSSGLVNINTAGSSDLESLPGVGPSTAQSIIDDRTQNGPFSSPEDLMRVSGIGEKKFEKLKGKICI